MWDLVSWPGIKPGPSALGAQGLSLWAHREVSVYILLRCLLCDWPGPGSRGRPSHFQGAFGLEEGLTWRSRHRAKVCLGGNWVCQEERQLGPSFAAYGNPLQFLAWKIPWTEEPGGLQSMGSQRVRHDWACMHACHWSSQLASFVFPLTKYPRVNRGRKQPGSFGSRLDFGIK